MVIRCAGVEDEADLGAARLQRRWSRVSVDGGSRWPSWAMTWWSPVSRNWRT